MRQVGFIGMGLMRQLTAAALALFAAAHTPAAAERLPMPTGDENFSAQALERGVFATRLACDTIARAVWAQVAAAEGECIRYWVSGLAGGPSHPRVLIYMPGDQLIGDQAAPGYASLSPAKMQSLVDDMASRAGVPVLLVARPGTFGSSGDHRQRRRWLEPQLVSKALDELKSRHGIRELSLVGLSGGGHTVASLLGWRSDITCAVLASSVSAPRLRWQEMGRTSDLTGYADSYEPEPHLQAASLHPALRVFVLGDPLDSNVKWSTQLPIATRLRALGVAVEVLAGEGSDAQRHALGASGRLIGALCLQGLSTAEILKAAARGLKG